LPHLPRSALLLSLAVLGACGGSAGEPPADPLLYGGDRPVRLQVPAAIEPGKTYPLVLVLHGYGANGAIQALYLQVSPATLPEGAFVLAPDGLRDGLGNRYWNATEACCGFSTSRADDVAYLGGLLDAVKADWPVDPSRVVAFGHSNGGFMAYRLACDRADAVTALAALAGAANTLDAAGCSPSAPVSVLHLHGTADATLLYEGGALPTGAYPGARASVEAWAALDGCDGAWTDGDPLDLEPTLAGQETLTTSAGGCPAGVAVELWTLQGAGHVPTLAADLGVRVVGWLAAHPRP
jgi:polyhydroxybutyrate depolymerase